MNIDADNWLLVFIVYFLLVMIGVAIGNCSCTPQPKLTYDQSSDTITLKYEGKTRVFEEKK